MPISVANGALAKGHKRTHRDSHKKQKCAEAIRHISYLFKLLIIISS